MLNQNRTHTDFSLPRSRIEITRIKPLLSNLAQKVASKGAFFAPLSTVTETPPSKELPASGASLTLERNTEEIRSPDGVEELPVETSKPLEVLLIAEGTYPFHWGGVSTWCHLLIRDLPEVNFTLYSLVADPLTKPQINLLPNVVDFLPVPLWGVRETLELRPDLGMAELRRRKQHTSEAVVAEKFVPLFRAFLNEMFLSDTEVARLGAYIHEMYRFFLEYDFDTTFHSQALWNCFVESMQYDFPCAAAQHGFREAEFSLSDITQGLQWLYHWFFPLSKPLPRVDVAHASTAGISTMVGVIAKLEYGAAFLLSEHGIYLRERYLAEAATSNTLFLKMLALRFARRMTDLSYVASDQISPCCDYNQRWELQNGVPPERLRTIYYGADADKFYAGDKPIGDPPVVVWVGRINPLKDVITLLKAAAVVHEKRPDIKFRLYGAAPKEDQLYYEECLALRAKLGLEEVVIFAGYASNAAIAYNEGDVVLLSSISEGFPFATLEAMLCRKPVVATSVGGLPEQIEGCGIVVEPRNPQEMGEAVLTLMNDPELCARYGKAAREKALQEFSVHQSREAYLSSYLRIVKQDKPETIGPVKDEDQLQAVGQAVAPSPLVEVESATRHSSGWQTVVELSARDNEQTGHPDIIKSPAKSSVLPLRSSMRRLQLLVLNRLQEWSPSDPESIRTLAKELTGHNSQPLDYLEVAAMLESRGITDDFALQQYGAPDTFELAKAVLAAIRAEPPAIVQAEIPIVPAQSFKQALINYLQGPISFLPGFIVLLTIQAYSFGSQWAGGQVMALSLGMGAGLLMTNGFLQAVMRRASICLSLGNARAASKFLIRSLGLAGVIVLAVALLAFLVTTWTGAISLEERLIFCLAFVALSAIWLVGGPLALVQAQVWLGIGLGVGLVTGFVLDRLTALFSDLHLVFGTIAGLVVTLGLIIWVERRAFAAKGQTGKDTRILLPSPAYLLYEAIPYFTYGILYAIFITAPHFLGWFGKLGENQSRQWAITSLEVGLTLAMPPLVLVGGIIERALRIFWSVAAVAQKTTPGLQVEQFSKTLLDFYRQQWRRYEIGLAGVSLAFAIPLWAVLNSGLLEGLLGSNPATAIIFLLTGLIIFFLLGQGLFNCVFCITLARPAFAVRAVFSAMTVMFVVGIPLSLWVDFSYCLVAFIAGAFTFVTVSSRLTQRLLASADYYYFSSF